MNDKNNATRRRIYRLISGDALCDEGKRIGYCWYNLHPGFLTKKLMDKHECIKKGGPFLERFKDHPYWIEKRKAKEKRAAMKQQKTALTLKQEEILLRFRELTEHLEGFAVCSCEHKDGFFLLRCATTERTDIRGAIHTLANEQNARIKVCFIQNTYAIRKQLIDKFKGEGASF